MLQLKNTTLVCVDGDTNHKNIINNIFNSIDKKIKFYDQIFITKVKNLYDYNRYIQKNLHNDIKSDFLLIIQWDGFPINISAWNNDWFKYDYIGAVWYNHQHFKNNVGNGGFSLRSKNFIKEMSQKKYDANLPEDVYFCETNRIEGMKYANIDVADKFSVEDKIYKNQFGFHGIKTIMMNKFLSEMYAKINHPLITFALNNDCRLTLNDCLYAESIYKKDPQNFKSNIKLTQYY